MTSYAEHLVVENPIINHTGTGNEIAVPKAYADKVKVAITVRGDHNRVTLRGPLKGAGELRITITGNHCSVELEEDIIVNRLLNIAIYPSSDGLAAHHAVSIGARSFFNGNVSLFLSEQESAIHIGTDCLFASAITAHTSDTHLVYDMHTRQRVNPPRDIRIGDHVWVGTNACFLKGAAIAGDCVVGAHAVVTRAFAETNVAIAGNPATICKRGINWQRNLADPIPD